MVIAYGGNIGNRNEMGNGYFYPEMTDSLLAGDFAAMGGCRRGVGHHVKPGQVGGIACAGLGHQAVRWLATVLMDMPMSKAIRLFECPSTIHFKSSNSRGVSESKRWRTDS